MSGWRRLRPYHDHGNIDPTWPAGDDRTVLVYDPCNGFSIWERADAYVPPGTHWRRVTRPAQALAEHAAHLKGLRG